MKLKIILLSIFTSLHSCYGKQTENKYEKEKWVWIQSGTWGLYQCFFRKSIYNIYLQRLTFILGLDINYVWVVFCIKLMINNDSNNITKWDRKSGDEVEGNLGDAGSTFTFHK